MGIQLKIGNDIDLDDEVMEDATVAKVKIERLQSTIIKSCISSTLADNNHNNNNNNNTVIIITITITITIIIIIIQKNQH